MSEMYLGLMSGTSLDGIDAAIVQFASPVPHILAAYTLPYTHEFRDALIQLARGRSHDEIEQLGQLDRQLGQLFADAALEVLRRAKQPPHAVVAIGSHGQTVRHRPSGSMPFTLQIADPNLIAEITGITTVADFRRRDMAAGGQGAPLVPAFHESCFRSKEENRAVLNIGGIANLTLLPADPALPVMGFDTGPGNVLLDAWIGKQQGRRYDAGGEWAASGTVQPALLKAWWQDSYFQRSPPKSTGREYFDLSWLEQQVDTSVYRPNDVQASLVALTAETISAALREIAPNTQRVLACGGGVRNGSLMRAISAALPDMQIVSTAHHGLDPDWVEAAAFAWMARATLAGRPSNVPSVTGARGARILGGIFSA